MAARTLDLPEDQVLADFFDPNGLRWHHRLLLAGTPAPGVWVASTPDYSVERLELGRHRVIPLARSAPIPADIVDEAYVFDNPVPERDFQLIRGQARVLLRVLGAMAAVAAAAADVPWLVADPSHATFGDTV